MTWASCRGLVTGYRGVKLTAPLDLTIGRGEVVLVVGRNGSGKSTFVRTLLGLEPPVAGEVTRHTRRLSYVPQAASIDGAVPLRVDQIVGWGRMTGWRGLLPAAPGGGAIAAALDEVGAGHLARRRFAELSGGERARVLLARMIATRAELAVLDEPTAAMDAASLAATYRLLGELTRRHAMGVVVVSHAAAVAFRHADQVVFFDRDREPPAAHVGPARQVAAVPALIALFGHLEAAGESADAA